MSIQDFYTDFAFTDLRDLGQEGVWAEEDKEQFLHLGVDKVYFSGDFPAILFKEVLDFSDAILKQIARIQHLTWNYRKVLFLFVVSKAEIRIYNCAKRPFNYEEEHADVRGELEKLEVAKTSLQDIQALETLRQIFSRVAVDSGTLWNSENSFRDRISLQDRIDRYLVKSLLATARALKTAGLGEDLIHGLLMRSLFIMYLEDKGAAGETTLYSDILPQASSYLHILENKAATYTLFRKVEEHFNGHVFPLTKGEEKQVTQEHLKLIRRCLYDGHITPGIPNLFGDWRLFRFDIVQIELLSEIYENFLEEFKGENQRQRGQYYTPPSLVELILNEKLPVRGESKWKYKVLDPACGSGIFLVESFKRLVKRWKNAHPDQTPQFADLRKILEDNIFGIEIDRLAIRVTTFSLYLALLEHLNPRTLWKDRRYKFPYLIYDPADKTIQNQGKNLFRQDTISENIKPDTFGKIDLVVGNPPFGASISLSSVKSYCERHGFGQDMVIPFLHKAIDFAQDGSIALIFNTKVLTNKEGPFKNFRKWLFNETYVEKIYNFSIFRKTPKTFGGQLFSSAVGPVSILFYEKTSSKQTSYIEYWAPKSYVKPNLIEGVVIEATDIKYLPRQESKDPGSMIWKIAMWATLQDFKLITKLNQIPDLADLFKRKKLIKGVGLQFMDGTTENPKYDSRISKLPYVMAERINRYYTAKFEFGKLQDDVTESGSLVYKKLYGIGQHQPLKMINHFRRLGQTKVFNAPHMVMKKGLSNKKLCAAYLDESCSFNSKVVGVAGGSPEMLKALTCILNSDLATYYLFLISSSIGIEREEIQTKEVYSLPLRYDEQVFIKLAQDLDEIKERILGSFPMQANISDLEKKINSTVFDLYSLTSNERVLVEDFMNSSVGLLFEGNKSMALKPVALSESEVYASFLCKELNDYLSTDKMVINASVFDVQKSDPLNVVKITFDDDVKKMRIIDTATYAGYLDELNRYSISSLAKNIYIQKQLKYYDSNAIYIIKPNQKRFWNRSMAINDSKDIINEILNMS